MTPKRRILLGVTGGIAAYKSADLVRRLRERGAEVQVVMTERAQQFVTPMTFQALSGRPVRTDLWDGAAEAAMGHIELARWADLVLVAPASADFLARLAGGRADDLLATTCLATAAPIALAPAMNRLMWANKATQANVAHADGARRAHSRARLRRPGLWRSRRRPHAGAGRARREPARTAAERRPAGRPQRAITAGPTREPLDPVRFSPTAVPGRWASRSPRPPARPAPR